MEYADDHMPQNTPPPLMLPTVCIPEPRPPHPPAHDDLIAAAVLAIRTGPRREPAAKAHKLRNYALVLERLAEQDEECEPMLRAAARLREVAEDILA